MIRTFYIIYLLIAISAGLVAGIFSRELIHNNDSVMDLFVTLFSILAGFIIAIMSLLGADTLRAGGWRRAKTDIKRIKDRLNRQQQLFWLYLITLSLILAGKAVSKTCPELSLTILQVAFGFAITSLVLSYGLPIALRGAQIAGMEKVADRRKETSGDLERN